MSPSTLFCLLAPVPALEECQGEGTHHCPVPHLLLQSPAQEGLRERRGCGCCHVAHSGGTHPMVPPQLPRGRVAACEASLWSEGRAASDGSLIWGKCVTSSRLGWGGLSRMTSLGERILGTGDLVPLSQEEPLSQGRREKESPSCGRTRWGVQCWLDRREWAAC